MKALCYLLKCTYINSVKRLFRKPLAALYTILALGVMCIPIFLTYFAEKSMSPSSYLDIIIGCGSLGYGSFILLVILSSNSGIFYMSDVNILFTAPIRSKKILLYGVFASFLKSILLSIYVIFNICLVGGAGVPFIIYIFTSIIFFIFITNIILIYYYGYLLSVKFSKSIRYMKRAILILFVLIGVIFIRCYILSGYDIINAAQVFFTNPSYNMLPIFGWVKWAIVSAISGNYIIGMLPAMLLQLGFMAFIILLIYNTDIDFYEKVLTDAQIAQDYKDKAKEGKQDVESFYVKKVKKTKASFRSGAKALWSRQVIEFKKIGINMSYAKYFINLIYVVIMVLVGMDMMQLVIFITFINVSFGSGESYMTDLKKPFIYLMPHSSLKKVFYNTLMAYCKSLISGAAAFLVILVMNDIKISDLISLYILYASYALVFLYATLFMQKFLGSKINMITGGLLRLIIVIIGSIPSTIFLVLFTIMVGDVPSMFWQSLATIVVNFGMAFILLLASRNIYETTELLD